MDSIADDVFYVCSREDYSNMRTVVHSVAFCDRILKLFDDSLYDSKLEYLIKVLIGSIVRTAINYKKAKTPMEWQEGKEYDSGTYGDPFKLHEYSMIFRFVEDYFYGSSFSEDRVKRVLDDFMREHEKNNPFDTLSSYWEMEDQAIKDAITRTREWLYEKKI